jgi:D-alanyl-lipoteichoic acid acyltransferase DltB (MBOAT superfamily)
LEEVLSDATMLFNSLQFAIFFPVVTLLYFALLHGRRGTMLLLASCLFYMAFMPAYIVILLVSIIFDYVAVLRTEGSSDIAIGAAQVMGFTLMKNFDRPYTARSMSEFWRRWHISLSTWFRDYLSVPLGGNRVARRRWLTNLFITFLVSGLWHGARWTFAAWGALHAAYLIASLPSADLRARIRALSSAGCASAGCASAGCASAGCASAGCASARVR